MKSLLSLFILLSFLQALLYPQNVMTTTRQHDLYPLNKTAQQYLPGQINENGQEWFLKAQKQNLCKQKLNKQLNSSGSRYVPVKVESDSTQRYTYAYDSKGNRTSETNERFRDGSWVNVQRTRMTYDNNGNVVAYIYDIWTEGQWVTTGRIIEEYNNNDKVITQLSEQWQNGQWLGFSRYLFTYAVFVNKNETNFYKYLSNIF
ncbi:MAG TPA: hypothetical protein VHO43_08255 [Ignavibacteriales bacterium]|nr:hypothetical protein [Ignavibacteriales bacterium]